MPAASTAWIGLPVLVAFLGVSAVAMQADAHEKRSVAERRQQPGKGLWANERASRHLGHARYYASGLGSYASAARSVQPRIAKSESALIGSNLAAVSKELRTVRKEVATDESAAAAIARLTTRLAQAKEQFKVLKAECSNATIDGSATMACCSKLTETLDQIIDEHGQLMTRLYEVPHSGHDDHRHAQPDSK